MYQVGKKGCKGSIACEIKRFLTHAWDVRGLDAAPTVNVFHCTVAPRDPSFTKAPANLEFLIQVWQNKKKLTRSIQIQNDEGECIFTLKIYHYLDWLKPEPNCLEPRWYKKVIRGLNYIFLSKYYTDNCFMWNLFNLHKDNMKFLKGNIFDWLTLINFLTQKIRAGQVFR